MNKRALFSMAQEVVLVFFTIFAVTLGVLMIKVGDFHINEIKGSSQELAENLYFRRMINSENCFAYEDPRSGRIDIGLIDLQKFTDEKLQTCSLSGLPPTQTPAKATLIIDKGGGQSVEIQTARWDSEGAGKNTYAQDVFVMDEGKRYEGFLLIQAD